MEDTIVAISTALGVGAISIIRVSGNDALNLVNKIVELYGDTILNSFGNIYLDMLQKEYFNVNIMGLSADSTFFHPQSIILKGLDEDGLCWKLIRMEYICISYEHVLPANKHFYDFILSEYKFLNCPKIDKYRRLPLYKDE